MKLGHWLRRVRSVGSVPTSRRRKSLFSRVEFLERRCLLAAVTNPFPVPLTPVAPLGSLAYEGQVSGVITATGDTSRFTIELEPGMRVTAVVTPTSASLQPTLQILDPGNQVLGNDSAPSAGQAVSIARVLVSQPGTYTFRVGDTGSTSGDFTLELFLNTTLEAEAPGTSSNDAPSTAQNLATSFQTLASGSVASVLGTLDGAIGFLPTEIEPNHRFFRPNSAVGNFSPHTGNLFQLGIRGTLANNSDEDLYAIGALQAGDLLTISMAGTTSGRGEVFDSFVELLRDNGGSLTLVASDDDGGELNDSLIHRFVIPSSGNYIVKAKTNLGATNSSYDLGLLLENTGAVPNTGATVTTETEPNESAATANDFSSAWRPVQYQSTTTGVIFGVDNDAFEFQFEAGDLVTFIAVGAIETPLRLYDSLSGAQLAADGFFSSTISVDSAIYGFIIPTSGQYLAEIDGLFGTPGPYQLEVYLSSATPPPDPIPLFDTYSIPLQAGQRLTLLAETLSAGDVDLRLADVNGTALATGAASATNADKVIVDFIAPATGTYFAQVSGARNTKYHLVALRDATFDWEDNNSAATAQPLAFPGTALGAISGNDDWYSINLAAGETIILSTRTPGDGSGEFVNLFDPRLEVHNPADQLVLSSDNSAADNRNVAVAFTAATSGTHRIRVRGTNTGEYSLTVAPFRSVTLSMLDGSFAENGGTATLQATLSAPSALDVIVHLSYSGIAVLDQDFQGATSLTIPAGQLSATQTLTGLDDLRDENDETLIVRIASVEFGVEATPQQVTTILLDDDPPPTLTLRANSPVLGESSGTATVTVELSTVSEKDITVSLAFGGSAQFGIDYTVSNISLLIPAGQASRSVVLTAVPDALPEAHESINVSIASAINGIVATPQLVTVILADDDHDPVANPESIILLEGASSSTVTSGANSLLANDTDEDLPHDTLTVQTTPVSPPAHGTLLLNADGTFLYTHDGSENFTDQFRYRLVDANGGLSSTAVVSITISPVNDNAPVAGIDQLVVAEGATGSLLVGNVVSLLANDTDIDLPNDQLSLQTTPVVTPQFGTVTLNANGTFSYTHDGGETLSDVFWYLVRDTGGHSSIGIVNITITPVNDTPIARPDILEVPEGGTATMLLNGATSVLANDSDAETLPAGMTLSVETLPTRGSLTLSPDGTFFYQHDGSETQSDNFVYRLTDPQGEFSLATVMIRIAPVNDNTPVAVNDLIEVRQGGSNLAVVGGAVSVAQNDIDADLPFDTFTVTPMSSPSHGSLTLRPDGSFFYTHDGTKTATDSFTYLVTDAAGHVSNTATVDIAIKLINEKPTANPGGPYVLAPGTDLVLNGSGSNDPEGDTLTYRWDVQGDGSAEVITTLPTATVPWSTLVSLRLVSGVTTVKLEVRDSSGVSALASTTLQIGSTYEFAPAADGGADEYIVSTMNGVLDIRRTGTAINLAPAGLTAITGVNLVGSSDDETFLFQSPSRTLSFFVDGNGGDDTVKVQGTAQADKINVSSPAGRIVVAKTTGVPFYVSATAETVCVLGSDGADTLDARQVTEALTSLQLLGENGNDTLTGGLGNDAFVGGDGTDLLSEIGPGNLTLTDSRLIGRGTDTIDVSIEAIKLTGDAGGNLFDASAFTRFGVHLDGAAGNDTLLGGSKADSLVGGDGLDEVRQMVSGNATLSNTLLVLGTSPNSVSDGLSSIERVKLTGSATANKFDATTFSGSSTLEGGGGNDTLFGGAGADLLLGGADQDSLLGNGGNDTIGGGTGNDKIDGGAGDDGLAGQDGNDTILGGVGNDTILGGAGNDSLRGGAGRDLIQGGAGRDNVNGEGDVDTVMGGSGGGQDWGDKVFDPFGEVLESFRFTLDWLSLI